MLIFNLSLQESLVIQHMTTMRVQNRDCQVYSPRNHRVLVFVFQTKMHLFFFIFRFRLKNE